MRPLLLLLLAGAALLLGGALWKARAVRLQTRYDALIAPVAARLGLDPLLIRAIIWRESRFQPDVRGLNKERGLMQVTPGVAEEWAQTTHSAPIALDQLFDPATNIAIGSWYFARLLHHWQETDNPTAFALAEYNAGRTNALRWIDPADPEAAAAFQRRISFPSTHRYVEAILGKYDEYRRGYFRSPWLSLWDRLLRSSSGASDQPTLEPASSHL